MRSIIQSNYRKLLEKSRAGAIHYVCFISNKYNYSQLKNTGEYIIGHNHVSV